MNSRSDEEVQNALLLHLTQQKKSKNAVEKNKFSWYYREVFIFMESRRTAETSVDLGRYSHGFSISLGKSCVQERLNHNV